MLLVLAVAITAGMFIDGATGKSFAMTGPDCIACHDGDGVPGEPWYNVVGRKWNNYTPELEPDGTMMNEHHYYVTERIKYSCYKCHPNNSTKTLGVCINCHYPGSRFGKGNALDITEAHEPKHDWTDVPQTMCSDCHEGNVFAEHSGRAQFVDTEGDLKCTLCHSNANQTVTDTAEFGGGHPGGLTYCDDCHISLSGTGTHGPAHNILFDEVDCTTSGCHVQDVVQEHFDRDRTCSTCHAGETYDSDPVLVQQVILDTGTGKSCSSCHGTDPHHTSPNAAVGNCEYCHADPRPDPGWTGAFPGDNGFNSCSDVPTQLACRGCHVKFDGINMKVIKYTRTDYVKYTSDYVPVTIHNVPSTISQINNYGICLGCHTGNPDPNLNITVFHARPDKHDSSWEIGVADGRRCTGYRERWDDTSPMNLGYAHFAPGRSSGTIGKFNLHKVPGFGMIPGSNSYDACGDEAVYASSPWNFTLHNAPAQLTGGPANVPVFPSLLRETPEGTLPACAAAGHYVKTLYSTQTYNLPYNARDITFTLKGGGGGGGAPDTELGTTGEPGSLVTAYYPSTAYTGTVLRVYAGSGGSRGLDTNAGAPGGSGNPVGGNGSAGEYWGSFEWAKGGAGGGGASAVLTEDYATTLARAKGGKGGDSSDWYHGGLAEWLTGGIGGAGGGANKYPGGTQNLTGGACGGDTTPTDGCNGEVKIEYDVP